VIIEGAAVVLEEKRQKEKKTSGHSH